MTHDELLAKIDNFASEEFIGITPGNLNKAIDALRAFVNIHKPITEIDLEDDEGNLFDADFCAICTDDSLYPCPTIEAIWTVLNA